MKLLRAGLGDSLESHVNKFGKISEVSAHRPDLYPTAYIFKNHGVTVSVTPLPKTVANIEVFFESVPAESVEKLLEAYSGIGGWNPHALSDLNFPIQFPAFSTTAKQNSFYMAKGAAALVQRDVGLGKLVLWIQSSDYQERLRQYRNAQNA
ncbi:MAG TPA: hypothetical protein VKY92_18970 [Verrucomicrobiae bacterium]|nr:hypothetical protein [Verrucomicrobiae bacterium]